MSNNYCESSSMIPIPKDKIEQAQKIMARIAAELEEHSEEGYVGYNADVEDGGVWVRHDESIDTDHAESLVKALVEELDLPGIFVCSWAYTCSKPLIDEFGGGAFAVQKGKPTIWIDAATEAKRRALSATMLTIKEHDQCVMGNSQLHTFLKSICELLMCSDPWPASQESEIEIKHQADVMARNLGFSDWIEAYHGL